MKNAQKYVGVLIVVFVVVAVILVAVNILGWPRGSAPQTEPGVPKSNPLVEILTNNAILATIMAGLVLAALRLGLQTMSTSFEARIKQLEQQLEQQRSDPRTHELVETKIDGKFRDHIDKISRFERKFDEIVALPIFRELGELEGVYDVPTAAATLKSVLHLLKRHDLPVAHEWLYNAATAEDDDDDKKLKKLIGTYHEFKNLADIARDLFNDDALAGLFSQRTGIHEGAFVDINPTLSHRLRYLEFKMRILLHNNQVQQAERLAQDINLQLWPGWFKLLLDSVRQPSKRYDLRFSTDAYKALIIYYTFADDSTAIDRLLALAQKSLLPNLADALAFFSSNLSGAPKSGKFSFEEQLQRNLPFLNGADTRFLFKELVRRREVDRAEHLAKLIKHQPHLTTEVEINKVWFDLFSGDLIRAERAYQEAAR